MVVQEPADAGHRHVEGVVTADAVGGGEQPSKWATGGGRRLLTLQECCMKTITRCINVHSVLELLEFCDIMGGMFPQGPQLKEKCMQFLVHTYESVRQIMGEEAIAKVLPKEVMRYLEEAAKDREESIKRVKIKGKVVERQPASPRPREMDMRQSVAGRSPHKYESLQAGVKWPRDVDPTCREEYLSEQEFRDVFHMTYQEYLDLPQWKRIRLKKDTDLF